MMKYLKIGIIILILTNCVASKKSKPCKQCPHYTWNEIQILEYQTMNPEVNTAINKIKLNGNKEFNKSNSKTRVIIF